MPETNYPEGYTFDEVGIPIEALRQGTVWFDRDGNEHQITEMHSKHRFHAYKKLTNAYGIYGARSVLGRALRQR